MTVRSWLPVSLLALCWAWSQPAAASGPPPVARGVAFHPDRPELIALYSSSLGLLLSSDGGESFRLVCHAMNDTISTDRPAFHYTADGSLLWGVARGLQRSSADGCNWSYPDAQLSDWAFARDVIPDPHDPQGSYAITSLGGAETGIFHSADQGQSWQRLQSFPVGTFLQQLRVSPLDASQMAMTVAVYDEAEDVSTPWLFRSSDGGENWTEHAAPLPDGSLRLLHMHPDDPSRLLAASYPNADETATLWLTEDGGDSWQQVLEVAQLGGFAATPDASRLWVGDEQGGLHLSEDGGASFRLVNEDLLVSCLSYAHERLWACTNNWYHCYSLGSSTDDGATFTGFFAYEEYAGTAECGSLDPAPELTCARSVDYLEFHFQLTEGSHCASCVPGEPGCDAAAGDAGTETVPPSSDGDGGTTGNGSEGGDAPIARDAASEDGGCGCRVAAATSPRHAKGQALLVLLTLSWLGFRRRRPCTSTRSNVISRVCGSARAGSW